MGLVLGRTGITVENGLTPAYKVLCSRPGYEVRCYPPYVVAEVSCPDQSKDSRGQAFTLLAKYIGVFGTPANKARDGGSQAVAMTAPVLMEPTEGKGQGGVKLAMTAPVTTEPLSQKMAFIMPSRFQSMRDLPAPTDPKVSLREVGERVVLAHQYSGNTPPEVLTHKTKQLLESVKADVLFAKWADDEKKVVTAGYNPPWTLPWLKRNEVWLPLPISRPDAEKMVADSQTAEASGRVLSR